MNEAAFFSIFSLFCILISLSWIRKRNPMGWSAFFCSLMIAAMGTGNPTIIKWSVAVAAIAFGVEIILKGTKKIEMTYTITRADLASITDVEMAFSTDRLLPAWEDIPDDFKRPNIYTQVADALFSNGELPKAEIVFLEGFKDETAPSDLNRCARAHIQSYGPKHEHKIAGVGFMMSKVCEIKPLPNNYPV